MMGAMSPRGVENPTLRSDLFAAAEAVLLRDGPAGVTGRSVTREAKCATGIIYNHFTDFDHFVAEWIVERLRSLTDEWDALSDRAGQGSVEGNLVAAALRASNSDIFRLADLVAAKPAAGAILTDRLTDGAPGFATLSGAISEYLSREQSLGRVSPDLDVEMAGTMLVAGIHHMLLGHARPDDLEATLHRMCTVLLGRPRATP